MNLVSPFPKIPLNMEDIDKIKREKLTGVYKIQYEGYDCLESAKAKYVGQSQNIGKRLKMHLQALKGGYHWNSDLQSHFNCVGQNEFVFTILEIVKIENDAYRDYLLHFHESGYIHSYRRANKWSLYNMITPHRYERWLPPSKFETISRDLADRISKIRIGKGIKISFKQLRERYDLDPNTLRFVVKKANNYISHLLFSIRKMNFEEYKDAYVHVITWEKIGEVEQEVNL